jgi:Cro/C1-type HTH DNA-binding domain
MRDALRDDQSWQNAKIETTRIVERDRPALDDAELRVLRTTPITKRMPNRIRLAMALMGVRSEDVIRATGIGRNTLSAMRNPRNRRSWRLPTVQRVADYFGCTVDDLFPMAVALTIAGILTT